MSQPPIRVAVVVEMLEGSRGCSSRVTALPMAHADIESFESGRRVEVP